MKTLGDVFGLGGKVALVTGASAGLGLEMAEAFATAGADLVVTARRQQRLDEVAARLQREYGVRVLPVAADLVDAQARERLFDHIVKCHRRQMRVDFRCFEI